MGKNIILCFDGTWNSPESETNIHKLFASAEGVEGQKAFYYTGVGAEGSRLGRMVEGATGEGILDKIREGYDDLASVYEPGDRIYIFGFSRGAYAARCLASIVTTFGLPTRYWGEEPETKGYTKELGDVIFDEYKHRARRDDVAQEMKDHCVAKAPVEMVGVFDTVSSLGLGALFGKASWIRYGFLDADWHPGMNNCYQALALDERRVEFQPERWKDGPGNSPSHKMEQQWFPGVHSDVGGGYHSSSSHAPLLWMMSKAQGHGLEFDGKLMAKYAVEYAADMGDTHESWTPKWGLPKERALAQGSMLSSHVALRTAAGGYTPKISFNETAGKVAPDGTDRFNMHRSRSPGEWVGLPWESTPASGNFHDIRKFMPAPVSRGR
jgi:uncharacterized protein (DUF2235 family)